MQRAFSRSLVARNYHSRTEWCPQMGVFYSKKCFTVPSWCHDEFRRACFIQLCVFFLSWSSDERVQFKYAFTVLSWLHNYSLMNRVVSSEERVLFNYDLYFVVLGTKINNSKTAKYLQKNM